MMTANLHVLMLYLILAVHEADAAAEFSIHYSPPSIKFSPGSRKTLISIVKEIFGAALGLSVDENTEWKGLYILDPFSTPEAAVLVYVDGVSSLNFTYHVGENYNGSVITFPLTVDEKDPKIYECVTHRIKQRHSNNGGNMLVNINLSNRDELASRHDVFAKIRINKISNLVSLKYSTKVDFMFLSELETLNGIREKVLSSRISPDKIVDFYNFRSSSLQAISDFHGPNSAEIEEAKTLLSKALHALSEAFVWAYTSKRTDPRSVFVTTIVSDVNRARRFGRSPDADTASSTTSDSNDPVGGPPGLDENFAAIFNIILWLCILYCLSLVAVVYGLMDMDPGRDSIIYRMTNIRTKKEA